MPNSKRGTKSCILQVDAQVKDQCGGADLKPHLQVLHAVGGVAPQMPSQD